MLFPLRVEDAQVDRVPWVSIGIAGVCALAFVATWIVPQNPGGISPEAARELVQYYQQHPYLEISEEFAAEHLPPRLRHALEEMHEDAPAELDQPTLALEQRHLDSLIAEFESQASGSALRRFSLVPTRGLVQPGWLTSMFLHFGWMHILGNLFFFYLTGPLLEDLWGRGFFGGFYLVGGLVAAAAHFALDPHSTTPMAGASGAIAACLGAFTWRCSHRKIRMAYFFWFRRGTFLMPAWLWGGFWFLGEVFSFVTHSAGGVAVMAHIGGFVFGFATAVVLAKSGYEAEKLAPAVAAATTWQQHAGTDAARAALERGDSAAALEAYRAVLRERPLDREALVAVARMENDVGRAEPLIQKLLNGGDAEGAWDVVIGLGQAFDVARVSGKTAWALGGAAAAAPEGMFALPDQLDAELGRRGGPLAAKAMLRLARRCKERGRPEQAREHLAALRAMPGLAPELGQAVQALAREVGLEPAAPAAAAVPSAAAPAPSAVRVLSCRLVQLSADALQIESGNGQQRKVELQKVVGVVAGVIPTPQGAAIVTDLILSWGDETTAPAALRIAGAQLGLGTHYPGLAAKDAYARLLEHLLSRTPPAPRREQLLAGTYPRFGSIAEFNAAFYRRDPARS